MATKVKIDTAKGVMIAELYDNETPITVNNFKKLIGPNFVIQGGCPNGNGMGGPGYTIQCEVSAPNQFHDRGVLSMAHAGRNTGGSQFFICHSRQGTAHLDRNHTCFGKVIEGLDVIDAIRPMDTINSISIVE